MTVEVAVPDNSGSEVISGMCSIPWCALSKTKESITKLAQMVCASLCVVVLFVLRRDVAHTIRIVETRGGHILVVGILSTICHQNVITRTFIFHVRSASPLVRQRCARSEEGPYTQLLV